MFLLALGFHQILIQTCIVLSSCHFLFEIYVEVSNHGINVEWRLMQMQSHASYYQKSDNDIGMVTLNAGISDDPYLQQYNEVNSCVCWNVQIVVHTCAFETNFPKVHTKNWTIYRYCCTLIVQYLTDVTTPFVTLTSLCLLSTQQQALGIIFKQFSMVTTSLICHQKKFEISYF